MNLGENMPLIALTEEHGLTGKHGLHLLNDVYGRASSKTDGIYSTCIGLRSFISWTKADDLYSSRPTRHLHAAYVRSVDRQLPAVGVLCSRECSIFFDLTAAVTLADPHPLPCVDRIVLCQADGVYYVPGKRGLLGWGYLQH